MRERSGAGMAGAIFAALLLAGCGSSNIFASTQGDELRFLSDTTYERTVGDRVIKGTYEEVKGADGTVRSRQLDDDGLGNIRLTPTAEGCWMSDRIGGPFCPK